MNIDKKALKSIVDEIEASRARQKGETEHQREVMKRAKNHQLDTKAVRLVLQRRAMGETKRDEQDYYVHAYEMALGGKKEAAEALERGATVRTAALAGGISTGAAGNLAKVVQKPPFVDKNKNASPQPEHRPAATTQARESDDLVTPVPEGGEGAGTYSGFDPVEISADDVAHVVMARHPNEAAAPPSVGAVAKPEAERVATPIDDLEIPPFLDVRKERGRGALTETLSSPAPFVRAAS